MPDGWVDPNTRMVDGRDLEPERRLNWLRLQIYVLADAGDAPVEVFSDGELIDQLRSVMGMG